MALDKEQEFRLALVNELVTSDPEAAHALADRFGELARQVATERDEKKDGAVGEIEIKDGESCLSPADLKAAQQIARNTGQPVHVMDVKAEPASPSYFYSGQMTEKEQERYAGYVASGNSPGEADYGIWLDRGREKLAAEIREQETNRQLQADMAEREGGQ